MTLPVPNLDDRDFEQLLDQARRRVLQQSRDWNDLSPSDPGMVLLELFAYLTESMIYRLNQLPDKAYVAFLNLIGVRLMPPGAASVRLTFSRKAPADTPLLVPRGTKVSAARATTGGPPPVFVTADTVAIAPGETEVEVLAHHGELIEGELIGVGTGEAGLSFTVMRPPIVAATGHPLDLLIGLEIEPGDVGERTSAIEFEGRPYRIWREVSNFSNVGDDPYVYAADRSMGNISFAPSIHGRTESSTDDLTEVGSALAAIPKPGQHVRAWYRSGGGPDGNLPAGALTMLRDPIPGVFVTNKEPATGGRPAEQLDNAKLRGPQELHSLERAVTARDFQLVALHSSGAVARAKAFTKAELWRHALPGTVQLLVVPFVPKELRGGGALSVATLQEHQTESGLTEVRNALESRRPAATRVDVEWARYKSVSVRARIVVHREEDLSAVEQRVYDRLHGTINPLPNDFNPRGWRFGEALRSSNVFDMILEEAGVRYADRVRLVVDDVPNKDILSIAADHFQPNTWFAGSRTTLFRSLNDGEGWEVAATLPGEKIDVVKTHPSVPGLIAVSARLGDKSSFLQISFDNGETWDAGQQLGFEVEDMAWTTRANKPILFLATEVGLYELAVGESGAVPLQVVVDAANPDRGFYAIVTSTDPSGVVNVALASQDAGGVYLSSDGGRGEGFKPIGLNGEDIRVLAVQYDGPRSFLWAGSASVGPEDPGKGCFSWELRGGEAPPEGWKTRELGWRGGTCWSFAFTPELVFAATHSGGVLRLDPSQANPQWAACDVRSGLPLRDPGRFHPVHALASNGAGKVLAGGPEGIARTIDLGKKYEVVSEPEFTERVTIPPTWLFSSGRHEVEMVSELAAD